MILPLPCQEETERKGKRFGSVSERSWETYSDSEPGGNEREEAVNRA
jgi:hypothetical protein